MPQWSRAVVPLEQQNVFHLHGAHVTRALGLTAAEDDAIRDGIGLSHHLLYSRNGVKAMTAALSVPYKDRQSLEDITDDIITERIRRWRRGNRASIVLDARSSPAGEVDPQEPRVIKIRWDLVSACALAKSRRSYEDYHTFLLQLAIAILHGIYQIMRLDLVSSQYQIEYRAGHMGARPIQGERPSAREGWRAFVSGLFGGETRTVVEAGVADRPSVKCLILYQPQTQWQVVPFNEIERLFKCPVEAVLPFSQNGWIAGINREPTLLDIEPTKPVLTWPHCVLTPPRTPLRSAPKCGYSWT